MRLANDVNTGTIATYDVTTPGWYRFRAAFSDASQFLQFGLRYDPPHVADAFRPDSLERLRCRVDDLKGYVADGFEESYLIGYHVERAPDDAARRLIARQPVGLQIGSSTFSLRFAGQILSTRRRRLRIHG